MEKRRISLIILFCLLLLQPIIAYGLGGQISWNDVYDTAIDNTFRTVGTPHVWYAKGYWWCVVQSDNVNDELALLKSTDRVTWINVHNPLTNWQVEQPNEFDVAIDENGNAHVVYFRDDVYDGFWRHMYGMINTSSDGTATYTTYNKDDYILYDDEEFHYNLIDWTLDGEGYPTFMCWHEGGVNDKRLTCASSTTKNGHWNQKDVFQPYITPDNKKDYLQEDGLLLPLKGTRDLIIIYSKYTNDTFTVPKIYSRYYDAETEAFDTNDIIVIDSKEEFLAGTLSYPYTQVLRSHDDYYNILNTTFFTSISKTVNNSGGKLSEPKFDDDDVVFNNHRPVDESTWAGMTFTTPVGGLSADGVALKLNRDDGSPTKGRVQIFPVHGNGFPDTSGAPIGSKTRTGVFQDAYAWYDFDMSLSLSSSTQYAITCDTITDTDDLGWKGFHNNTDMYTGGGGYINYNDGADANWQIESLGLDRDRSFYFYIGLVWNDESFNVYYSADGSDTWVKKVLLTDNFTYVGSQIRFNEYDDVYVISSTNNANINGGNRTFHYWRLFNLDNWGSVWNEEYKEIGWSGIGNNEAEESISTWCVSPSGSWNEFSLLSSNSSDGYIIIGNIVENPRIYPQPELINITIRGYEDYLFEGEVYEIDSYWNNTDYCYFQLDDTEHIWKYFYYNESQYMGIDVTDFEGLITNELVIGCPYVYIDDNFTGGDENLTRLKWKFILNAQVVDCFNRTLSYYGENQQGNVTSGDTIYDEINMYNLGGYVTYDIVGDAGRLTKGDAWELWAENGTVGNPSYAYAETIFRKLQHVHFLVEIDLDLEWNSGTSEFDYDGGGFVEYGFDYRISQIWVTGWKVRLYPSTINVGNHAGGVDHNRIQWAVEWFYNGTKVKEEIIYSNCYGYDHADSNHGYTNRTSAQLWVDLWFNKMNSSTVVGGRVNSYYYGSYEQGSSWWFGYGAFRPMTGDVDASMYFDDLKDIGGTVFTCQKLEIIRAWAKVTKIDDADSQDNRWEIKNYEILNWLLAQDRMMGTDTPIFVQTKILEVTTQHGFIQSLYIAITGLGATIWKGALGFTKIFVGAIDSLLMFLGLPEGTFTSLTQMIMMQFTQFLTWMTYLVAQVSNMLSVFSGMISFILQVITNTVNAILWIFENAIAFPINVMKLLVAILNGETIILWGRLWDYTSAYGFIEAGKQMLPISIGVMFMFWLLYGNVQGEGDEDLYGFPRRVLDMFGWFKEIYQNVFFIFNRIRNEIITMYNFIRSHIPSMGGGGGETEE